MEAGGHDSAAPEANTPPESDRSTEREDCTHQLQRDEVSPWNHLVTVTQSACSPEYQMPALTFTLGIGW